MPPRDTPFNLDKASSDPSMDGREDKLPPKQPIKRSTSNTVDIQQRDYHDIFNLLVLPFLVAETFTTCCLTCEGLRTFPGFEERILDQQFDGWVSWIRNDASYEGSCHESNQYRFVGVWWLYFIADLLWVYFIPSCVKSPGTIIKHHLVSIPYFLCMFRYPLFNCFATPILSVEINTWFLICRRVLFLRKDSPYVPQLMRDLVDYAFYASWILIRVFVYGVIQVCYVLLLADQWKRHKDVSHIFFNFPWMFVVLQTLFTMLNLQWTYALFQPIIKRNLLARGGKGDKVSGGRDHTL